MIDEEYLQYHIDYPQYPTRSIVELRELTRLLPNSLTKITKPVLLINSKSDRTVPMQHPDEIEKLLENSAAVERVTLESSGHIITEDIERDTVFRNISDFIKKHSKDK